MSDIADYVSMPNEQPSIEPYLIECKFTVKSREVLGNATKEKRVTFDGYATGELYSAIMDAIRNISTD